VVRELRPGYRLGERVLRPAQVSVARATTPRAPRRARSQHTPQPPSNGDLTVL